ncbi:MAG TPA: isoprenylcysteine carboxylmethyltransferase family protein [Gemmatimonadales bacterium]|nr:isoprenylcysteine carboxylmethyltransferase family protein [Gemmatimonadales bacterium]
MPDPSPKVANPGFIRPPQVYLVAVLIGLGLQVFWPLRLPGGATIALVGTLLIAAAVITFGLTVRAFAAASTPVPGNQPATALVRSGPLRFSRNPIYLSFTVFQLGLGLLLHNAWILLMLIFPVVLMDLVVIPREEHFMEMKFGADYADYKAKVRRWI